MAKVSNPHNTPVEGAAISALTNMELASVLRHRADELAKLLETMTTANMIYTLPHEIGEPYLNRCLDALKEVSDRCDRDRQEVGKGNNTGFDNCALKSDNEPSQVTSMGKFLDAVDKAMDEEEQRVCKLCKCSFKYLSGVDDNLCGTCSARLYGDK